MGCTLKSPKCCSVARPRGPDVPGPGAAGRWLVRVLRRRGRRPWAVPAQTTEAGKVWRDWGDVSWKPFPARRQAQRPGEPCHLGAGRVEREHGRGGLGSRGAWSRRGLGRRVGDQLDRGPGDRGSFAAILFRSLTLFCSFVRLKITPLGKSFVQKQCIQLINSLSPCDSSVTWAL